MLGPQLLVVDLVADRDVGALGRRRDQHLPGARLEVPRRGVALGEDAGALHHHVDPELAPRQLGDVALGQHLDRPGAAVQRVALELDLAGEAAVHRIVAQQMRVGRRRRQVVDRDHRDVGASLLDDGAQHVAADPAEAVDGDANAHGVTSFIGALTGSGRLGS